MPRTRAAAIIVKDNAVALIKRIREDKVYYLFPGGGVEENEAVEDACIREIDEELGLKIAVDREIAQVVVHESGNIQHHFLCHTVSGIFGSGTGAEYQLGRIESAGIYEPVRLNIDELLHNDVRPKCICEMIVNGYPDNPKKFIDYGNGVCVESL